MRARRFPALDLRPMICGHRSSALVHHADGTIYCLLCEEERQPLGSTSPDRYMTPRWAIARLLDVYTPPKGLILEPACGTENIVRELRKLGYPVAYSDLDWGKQYDFLSRRYAIGHEAKTIITNPPFSIAKPFIEKALTYAATEVVMLLRLGWLASKGRHAFWIANPIRAMVVLSSRPSFQGGGTDYSDYAWFIWSKRTLAQMGISAIQWVVE